jgi:hypothetical protein
MYVKADGGSQVCRVKIVCIYAAFIDIHLQGEEANVKTGYLYTASNKTEIL